MKDLASILRLFFIAFGSWAVICYIVYMVYIIMF